MANIRAFLLLAAFLALGACRLGHHPASQPSILPAVAPSVVRKLMPDMVEGNTNPGSPLVFRYALANRYDHVLQELIAELKDKDWSIVVLPSGVTCRMQNLPTGYDKIEIDLQKGPITGSVQKLASAGTVLAITQVKHT